MFLVSGAAGKITDPPDDFAGWRLYIESDAGLSKSLTGSHQVELYHDGPGAGQQSIWITPHLLEWDCDETYPGSWAEVASFADAIRKHGLPPPHLYATHPAQHYLQQRRHYFERVQLLGGDACILFCADKHPEWLHYASQHQWTLEQFIAWAKREFVFVAFSALVDFDFPSGKDYYNVCIYDNFGDLKA